MPANLTLSQRLTGPDGLPTAAARIGAVALVGAAAALGFVAGPDGGEPARPAHGGGAVAINRLAGEFPTPAPEPHPSLRAAVALPSLQGGAPRRSPRRAAPVATPVATPAPTAAPEPTATPQPVVVQTPAPAPQAPAPRAQPKPRPTPAPIFGSSG